MIKNRNVQIEAADALLDVGISLPFFKIPFIKKTVRLTMRRPCLGTQIRITKLYLEMGVSYEDMEAFSTVDEELTFIAKHGVTVSRMLALAVCRGAVSGWLFSRPLAFLMRCLCDDRFLFGSSMQLLSLLKTKSFSIIINSAEMMNPMKLSLSQKRKGS